MFVGDGDILTFAGVTGGVMRTSFQEETGRPERGERSAARVIGDIKEGLGWLWHQPVIRFLTLMETGDNLRYGCGYLVIISRAEAVKATPAEIGLIFSGAAVGALAGSLMANRAVARFALGHIAVAMLWAEALIFPLYVL
jgi:hypothetical protein